MNARLPSHYEVLGLPVTASQHDVRSAYRKAARAHHPDQGGDAAEFRRVTLAFEILSDPRKREDYDRSYWANAPQREAPEASDHASAGPPDGAGAASGFSTQRRGSSAEPRARATDPARYEPPAAPGTVPLLSPATASLREHGEPRRRGLFGAEARIQRERRTAEIVRRHVLPSLPSARLLNGLRSPGDHSHVAHAVLAGYRLALVESMLLPSGNYAWDGRALRHGGRTAVPPDAGTQARFFQEVFPELHVTSFVVALTPESSLHQPVIDIRRGAPEDTAPLNGSAFIRELKFFLGAGPQPNVVYLPALARLLKGLH